MRLGPKSGGLGLLAQGPTATTSVLKLRVPAGEAAMGPPIGPALGQRGVRAVDFCRQFNEQSLKIFAKGTPLRCLVHVSSSDRKFTFALRTPTTVHLLKSATGTPRTSTRHTVCRTTAPLLYEIACIKHRDFADGRSLRGVYRMVLATAKACGFQIVK